MQQDADWLADSDPARRKGKDSVFCDLFNIPRYAAEITQTLHPELSITEQDIDLVSLHSVLMVRPYNDLGILVKDKFLFCSEAQSTWSLNVLVRMFMYLAETYHRYIQNHKEMNLYGPKKITLPTPECCVIYTGRDKDVPEELSLATEFFGQDSPLDLRVKVFNKPGKGDIIQQYIRFCHVFDDQVHLHGRTKQSIEETIRICQSEGVLATYLADRAKEVEDIMMTLFSQEEATERYGHACREEGRSEGKTEMVLEMLKAKQPLDFIARISNFSKEKISEIGRLNGVL